MLKIKNTIELFFKNFKKGELKFRKKTVNPNSINIQQIKTRCGIKKYNKKIDLFLDCIFGN